MAILSISVDPTNDRPAVLRRYGSAFGIDGKHWRLLTGSLPKIMKVTRSFSAMRPGQGRRGLPHQRVAAVRRPGPRLIQRYAGAPLATNQLRADLFSLAHIG
ncbi:SCO family protein [Sphingomonas sp. MMS24-JH45]